MATLTLQPVRSVTGTTVTPVSASAGGDRCPVGDNVLLHVRNASAGSVTVTLDATGKTFNAADVPDTAVVVAAGAEAYIPVGSGYRAASDGLAGVSYSAAASVTVAALAV